MNSHHEHPSFIDYVIGFIASIILFIIKVFNGWVEHNGGATEMCYSIMSILFFGFIGATGAFIWNRYIFKKK